MDVVAIVALARSVEDEDPVLAADLGLTAYETAMMLRSPRPVIVLRSEHRARALELLGKLRSRGHDAVLCDLETVTWSEDMFSPKAFRFEAGTFVGIGNGEERRLALTDIFALVRATVSTHVEDMVTSHERKLSMGRAALTGGLLLSKVGDRSDRRVTEEHEPVLYVFRIDAAPWLLRSTQMRYHGLANEMKRSQVENFDVLIRTLRELAPSAPFDARLLSVRARANTLVTSGSKHLSVSSSGTIDVLAHIVASSLGRAARPYR
jgi:hypothetical protein